MLREHQKGHTDCQSLAQWVSATASPTWDELQASSRYLRVVAQHLERIAELDKMHELRDQVDGTNRVIVPSSLIEEVIEEAHQRPGTAQECSKKVLQHLVHSYSWPGLKKDVQRGLEKMVNE